MRKLAIMMLPLLALSLSACGDDSSTNDDLSGLDHSVATGDMAKTVDMTTSNADMPPPAAPTLGAQIDRMGRAGVNTAVTDPFWDDGTQTKAAHTAKQDAYNALSDPAAWATSSIATSGPTVLALFKGNLAVYDALSGTSDGTMANDGCGDQLGYGALSQPRYATLAGVLADDQLYVNTGSGTCAVYLGAEANVLGVTNSDCGGRTPNYNTIDITYTGFAVGAGLTTSIPGCITGSAACAVSNGITVDPDANVATTTTFPFLGAPN